MRETPNGVGGSTEATSRAADPPASPITPGPPKHRSWKWVVALAGLGLVLLVGIVVGTLTLGGFFNPSDVGRSSADIVRMAPDAVATAPGVRYQLSIEAQAVGGIQGFDVSGLIDLRAGRFAGDADSGRGAVMLLFGGPRAGSLVLADGLFIHTEDGPWEAVPIENAAELRPFVDPATLARAMSRAIDLARLDPVVRTIPCAIGMCQVVGLQLPATILGDLTALLLGGDGQPPPKNMQPIVAELWLDSETGFPAHLEARVVAGTTTTRVVLDLERLDPPPLIDAPVP